MRRGGETETAATGRKKCQMTTTLERKTTMNDMHLMADALGLGNCWIQGRCREAENGQSTECFCRELLGVPENLN